MKEKIQEKIQFNIFVDVFSSRWYYKNIKVLSVVNGSPWL